MDRKGPPKKPAAEPVDVICRRWTGTTDCRMLAESETERRTIVVCPLYSNGRVVGMNATSSNAYPILP
jgi:hypothetical protein